MGAQGNCRKPPGVGYCLKSPDRNVQEYNSRIQERERQAQLLAAEKARCRAEQERIETDLEDPEAYKKFEELKRKSRWRWQGWVELDVLEHGLRDVENCSLEKDCEIMQDIALLLDGWAGSSSGISGDGNNEFGARRLESRNSERALESYHHDQPRINPGKFR